MANKKEPPYFNEDNVGKFNFTFPFYDTMELFIETLTGTCFELRVSPFETVFSVKAKIQRLEGIPVTQQHLIWNNLELEDDYCLNDYSISEGSTLKLVLAMRGGPINTRRVTLEDPLREMADYMDACRDEVWEKAPSSKQVTLLVFREGDQLSFFRVVDRGDGTLTPLSESLSGGSVYNLYADNEDEADLSPSGQQILENSVTMNKMKLLKTKMENMNLSKKPKKTKIKPRPPLAPRPAGSLMAAGHHSRLLRVLPHIGQPYLPPPGNLHPSQSSQSALSTLTTVTTATRTMPSISMDYLNEEKNWDSHHLSPSRIGLPPKISRMEIESGKLNKNSILPPVAHQPKQAGETLENMANNIEGYVGLHPDLSHLELRAVEENTMPIGDGCSLCADVSLPVQHGELYGAIRLNQEFGLAKGDASIVEQNKSFSKSLNSESVKTSTLNSHELSPQRNALLTPLCSAQMAHSSLVKPPRQPKSFDVGNLRHAASQNLLHSLEVHNVADSSLSRTTTFRGVKVDSPGKRPEIISKMEARDITKIANKAAKEPIGSVNNLEFFTSLARSASRNSLQNSCGTGRLRTSTAALPTNLQHFQEESFTQTLSPSRTIDFSTSSHHLVMNGNNAATGKRVVEATHLLPPLKTRNQKKKKTTKYCFLCGKKTGLASSYSCRCGNNFCATHRYAETHDCTYDYKTAGRMYLLEANPVVTAPKLPKI